MRITDAALRESYDGGIPNRGDRMKSIKILAAIFLFLAFPAMAQSDQELAAAVRQEMGMVQMNAQQTQQMYQIAQMGGTQVWLASGEWRADAALISVLWQVALPVPVPAATVPPPPPPPPIPRHRLLRLRRHRHRHRGSGNNHR